MHRTTNRIANVSRSAARQGFFVAGLCCVLITAGCASWHPFTGKAQAPEKEPVERKTGVTWSENVREPTAPGSLLGIDQRARDIERRLGVQ
jgi:hypothetical protein